MVTFFVLKVQVAVLRVKWKCLNIEYLCYTWKFGVFISFEFGVQSIKIVILFINVSKFILCLLYIELKQCIYTWVWVTLACLNVNVIFTCMNECAALPTDREQLKTLKINKDNRDKNLYFADYNQPFINHFLSYFGSKSSFKM